MLHAELHGKIGRDTTEAERSEDILTSTVFGVLFSADAWNVLADWLCRARPIVHEQPLHASVGADKQYWFWPRLDGAEPDLVLRIGSLLVTIEAKYHSGKSGSDKPSDSSTSPPRDDVKDQLVREWNACSPRADCTNYPVPLRQAIECCDRALVYVVRRDRLTRERPAIEQSAQQQSDARMFLLTWEDLDDVLAMNEHAQWHLELRAYLRRKGLAAFRGFASAVTPAPTGLRAWRFQARGISADVRNAFVAEQLLGLKHLADWRGGEVTPSALEWARVMAPDSLPRLHALAERLSSFAKDHHG